MLVLLLFLQVKPALWKAPLSGVFCFEMEGLVPRMFFTSSSFTFLPSPRYFLGSNTEASNSLTIGTCLSIIKSARKKKGGLTDEKDV